MRALTISAHGGLEQLEYRTDLPVPEIRSGTDVRVRLRAAALNRLDLFVVGGLPGVTIMPPWIMGADGAGEIDAIGAEVRDLAPGDPVIINPGINDRTCEYCRAGEQSLCVRFRLLGEHLPGTIAEYVVVPASNVRVIPRTSRWEEAAAFTLVTLTAWRMVVTRAAVKEGEDVLIWGIGGGVSLAALQIVKRRGARAWVTSGSDEKLARARELGAHATFNHRRQDVGKEIRARTGKRGMDVVIENVGVATWRQSLEALGRRGRLVTCGATSGPVAETDLRRMFWNQWTLMGSTMGNDDEFDAVADAFRRGELAPIVDSVFDMPDGRAAFERLKSGTHFGKIALRIAGD